MSKILLSHGAGGRLSQKLITEIFKKSLSNEYLNKMDDAADLKLNNIKISFTTDSFVIKPIFFSGGDIGKLAVCGTVNDLVVNGAKPLYLSLSFIIEEGFDIPDLEKIIKSISYWVKQSGVMIVTGDTKVVEKGAADGIFINTSGIGKIDLKLPELGIDKISPCDSIILTGSIAEHGLAVLSNRKGLEFENIIESDCAPLVKSILKLREEIKGIKFMRDPTRGGVATTLNEIVANSEFGILIEEDKIPINPDVEAVCQLLGLDPLYIANEGKAIIIVDKKDTKKALEILKKYKETKNSVIIGEITNENKSKVIIKTRYGVGRILQMLQGEQFPRIC